MKHLISVLTLVILASCNMKNTPESEKIKQNPNDILAIKTMLNNQQEYWNNGDIDGFMQGYWNSEELIFTSLRHKPAYGWNNTLERYKSSYPTKSSMGELKFQILDLKLISKTTANLKGKWKLLREKDNPNGIFWLDIEKFDKDWLITKDSTLSFEINTPL